MGRHLRGACRHRRGAGPSVHLQFPHQSPPLRRLQKRGALAHGIEYDYDKAIYQQRNVIERMFCRLNDWRRIATRFDRNIKNFMAAVALAATVMW